MKRLFVILLSLCTWVAHPMLQAQIYTTSSASYRSVSSGGVAILPTTPDFRSTSAYVNRTATKIAPSVNYSTAPIHMANGKVTTVASQLKGELLADIPASSPSNGFSPKQRAVIPGVPLPLSDGWDVALLLSFLCLGYAIYIKQKSINGKVND